MFYVKLDKLANKNYVLKAAGKIMI